VVGAGYVQFGGDGGVASPKGGRVDSDLRSDITMPYLWATVQAISVEKDKTTVTLEVERGGGLRSVRVSRSGLEKAAWALKLRTREGDTGAPRGTWLSRRAPPFDPEDYAPVPEGGLRLTVDMSEYGRWGYFNAMDLGATDLPFGSEMRYYLCTEVRCCTDDMKKQFWVPLLGVGLVRYGK
jgi:hypothetical protein